VRTAGELAVAVVGHDLAAAGSGLVRGQQRRRVLHRTLQIVRPARVGTAQQAGIFGEIVDRTAAAASPWPPATA